jgi:hypothetical protein
MLLLTQVYYLFNFIDLGYPSRGLFEMLARIPKRVIVMMVFENEIKPV